MLVMQMVVTKEPYHTLEFWGGKVSIYIYIYIHIYIDTCVYV